MSSVIGSRVGSNNRVVAVFEGTATSGFGAGFTGFADGSNGFNAWLPSDVDFYATSGAGDIRRYIARQSDDAGVVTGGTANSGLTFSPDTSSDLAGPRKTDDGPQLVLVFGARSL